MIHPLSILVLCGGQSTEHAISLLSARNVVSGLNSQKYRVSVAVISQTGSWLYFQTASDFLQADMTRLSETNSARILSIMPGHTHPFYFSQPTETRLLIDCVFPVLHGTNGEDGTMQGLLTVLNLPIIGPDYLSATLAMDKAVTKSLWELSGLPVVPWREAHVTTASQLLYQEVAAQLGEALFIKPNSLGSSVGIAKATNEKTFQQALANAFRFDDRVLIEKAVVGREIECSVLGNEKPIASLPGEIINHTEFYSYEAKYLSDDAATVVTPADLPTPIVLQIQTLSVKAFQAIHGVGMARVDFFLMPNEKIVLNEINTIPGFTDISMYSKNWAASGLSYTALLDELIQLGMAYFQSKKSLIRVFTQQTATENANISE